MTLNGLDDTLGGMAVAEGAVIGYHAPVGHRVFDQFGCFDYYIVCFGTCKFA